MRALGLAIGWLIVAIVVWLSLTPAPPTIEFEQSDKLGHLAAYGVLTLWFCQLYRRRATRALYATSFVAMGVVLEFLQDAGGVRSFEWLDMGANALGVLLGWGVALVLPRVPRAAE